MFGLSNKRYNDRNVRSSNPPLPISWIITEKFAIGPMPRSSAHWKQLEDNEFTNRFSCCYPEEHIFAPIPSNWNSVQVSLPDHRCQEEMTPELLESALAQSKDMIDTQKGPIYIHCYAGRERSSLLAIGLVCIIRKIDVFDGLNLVRRCHKNAKPIYSHLEILDQLLKARHC